MNKYSFLTKNNLCFPYRTTTTLNGLNNASFATMGNKKKDANITAEYMMWNMITLTLVRSNFCPATRMRPRTMHTAINPPSKILHKILPNSVNPFSRKRDYSLCDPVGKPHLNWFMDRRRRLPMRRMNIATVLQVWIYNVFVYIKTASTWNCWRILLTVSSSDPMLHTARIYS